jgi:hypothetical protein
MDRSGLLSGPSTVVEETSMHKLSDSVLSHSQCDSFSWHVMAHEEGMAPANSKMRPCAGVFEHAVWSIAGISFSGRHSIYASVLQLAEVTSEYLLLTLSPYLCSISTISVVHFLDGFQNPPMVNATTVTKPNTTLSTFTSRYKYLRLLDLQVIRNPA